MKYYLYGDRKELKAMYEILSRKKCCVLYHFNQFDDPEQNLSLLYDPDSIDFDSESFTLNDAGQHIRLYVSRKENYRRDPYSVGFDRSHIGLERLPKEYKIWNESVRDENGVPVLQRLAPETDCKYHELFEELDAADEKERRRIWSMLLDSRNTGKRISAKIIDNKLHIFTETYNYDMPESGEYYLMDYCDGAYTFSVSDVSRFMTLYLLREKYLQYYGEYSESNTRQYTSLEEIAAHENDYAEKRYYEREMITKHRMNAFQQMQSEIDDLRRKLKRGKAQIRSRELFGFGEYAMKFIAAFKLIELYKAKTEFCCEGLETLRWENMCVEFYLRSKKRVEFRLSDGRTVNLSRNDLYNGYELGLTSIEEIGQFLLKYGKISIRACMK